jgi:hypothetical protein
MPRTIPTLAAVLAALTIAAPAASATPADDAGDTWSPAATTSSPDHDLRSVTRNAARRKTPSDISRALAQERYYMGSDNSTPARHAVRPKTPSDVTTALAQERYYMGPDDATPITPSASPEIRADDGIASLLFILAISGALIIGLATGSGLHLLHVRRRHATSIAT